MAQGWRNALTVVDFRTGVAHAGIDEAEESARRRAPR